MSNRNVLPPQQTELLHVRSLNDPDALEAFARRMQASRDATAERTWRQYTLTEDGKGVVKADGTVYRMMFKRSDQSFVFPDVFDQRFCSEVNAYLSAICPACMAFRLMTKHWLIRHRLIEVRQAEAARLEDEAAALSRRWRVPEKPAPLNLPVGAMWPTEAYNAMSAEEKAAQKMRDFK